MAFSHQTVNYSKTFLFLTLLGSLAFIGISACIPSREYDAVQTLRRLPIAERAWAGSSVNVLAGTRQNLFTDGVDQYAAWYGPGGSLFLGKRRLGEESWQVRATAWKGRVEDAHNHVSLIVDGRGYLHLSFDQHNSVLRYARSVEPGSLELREASMLGRDEDAVTYPQFLRLSNGDLLFAYRQGGAGRGRTLLNRYDLRSGQWQRLHDSLIDGGQDRSAYWDMAVDGDGRLHLAWVWRDTPDVADNHDLAYAASEDGGRHWQNIDGQALSLPMTVSSPVQAWNIPPRHKLMNPPVVGSDWRGRPYLASYWADDTEAAPRMRVVANLDGQWQEFAGPQATRNFALEGRGTKRPPWSRPALLVESRWNDCGFHLVYRDDFAGAVTMASLTSVADPQWRFRRLLKEDLGGWEPAVDPEQWRRLGHMQVLLQTVSQRDGDDSTRKPQSSALSLLDWSPNWERHQGAVASDSVVVPDNLDQGLEREKILDLARKAALWQWQHLPSEREYHPRAWAVCPLYIGSLAVDAFIPDAALEQRMVAKAQEQDWQPHQRIYDADDHCVMQAYLELYLRQPEPHRLAPSKARLDHILAQPAAISLDWGTPRSRDRWSWSDALFMGPMSWLLMSEATGNPRYLDFMDVQWWATYERLFSRQSGFYFRDESYLDVREKNGRTLHWARGTGWSFAGLARVLQRLPADHPHRPRYEEQFKRMAQAFKNAQQADGLWRPGLLDPRTHNARETSGSAFAVFGMASGINQGLLEREDYFAAVQRGWNALAACVTDDGKLEHVQPIGAAPTGFDPHNSEPFATGALLLAASEVQALAEH